MRECRNDYAHGPMKLTTTLVETEYRGETFTCEKTRYSCTFCDFELHLDWMEEKLQKDLEAAYREKHNIS